MSADCVIEAKLLWGTDVLSIAYVVPERDRSYRLRDVRLPLPPHDADLVVARLAKGRLELVMHEVRLGACTLSLALVAREAVPSMRMQSDGRVVRGVALAFAFHAAFMVLAYASRSSAAESEERQLALLKAYSTSAEERAKADVVLPNEAKPDETDASAAKGEEGVAGNPTRVTEVGRRRKTLGENPQKVVPGEEKTFGMIALLQGHSAGNSAWATEVGQGAMGNIFGVTIDDAAGAGGLGLSGAGEGGGGIGAAVPLARIGTGTGQGFGSCHCRIGGEHTVRPPVIGELRMSTNGRLPAEAIQRIVRQNFGRFRLCYQRGLERDAGLEGRVAVKFVIDREGEVAVASVAERTLEDESVAQCVATVFSALSFPKPTGGIVTVTYPIVFEKG